MSDSQNKIKTYSIVLIFILIIFVCMFIVISKAINRDSSNKKKTDNVVVDTVLKESSISTELSLKNKKVESLYSLVNDVSTDYKAYLENENISWNIVSYIVSKSIYKDKNIVSKEEFENRYYEIFDQDIIEYDRVSNVCGGASYNLENDYYIINDSCIGNPNIRMISFLKNITYLNDMIYINKYYSFVDNHFNESGKINVYVDNSLQEDSLIAYDINESDVPSYISKMNILSYVFKKNKKGEYYLYKIVK